MPEPSIAVERDGAVVTITIAREHARNALDLEATDRLHAAIRAFEQDDDLAVAVLWGRGGSFCAGADLREMADKGAVYRPWAGEDGPFARPPEKPVIAAVEGHAVAGGLGVALWCDLRVADETAVFGVFCRRFGVPMSDGTTVRLPRVVGLGRALDMLHTGRPVNAEEALAIGLADRVVARGTALREAMALARQIASFPQVALRADRRSALESAGLPEAEALRREAEGALEAKRLEAQAGAARFAAGVGRHGASGE